jgi:CRP-like cAMP-binding protein
MVFSVGFEKNHLLRSLTADERARWLPLLEPVELPLTRVLHEPGCTQSHAYFPTTAIVSIVNETADGASAEIAMVGNEGLVGIPLFMGGETMPSRAMVHSGGKGYRLRAQLFKDEFDRFGPVTQLILRYVQALITQMSQTAVCIRHHPLSQRFCRWLLLSLDRLPGNELMMTHEMIATMLGVRRESVTECALKLHAARLIRYTRGHMWVLDRTGLEAQTCECYAVVKNEYERLLRHHTEAVGVTNSQASRSRRVISPSARHERSTTLQG